jgi:hypothetical protein
VVSCPNYPSLQNYAVLGSPKTTSFSQNGVVLGILGFSFFFFLKKRRKKKGGESRGGWSHPCPKMGWPDHPIFGQGVAEPAVWGWPKPPQAFGGGLATPKGQKKKKRKGKMGFGLWGWLDHPLGPGCGFETPPTCHRGWPKPPPVFFFLPFGVAGPPPKAWGGFDHPHTAGSATPRPDFWARGGSSHPLSPSSSSFFFFFFNSFFF